MKQPESTTLRHMTASRCLPVLFLIVSVVTALHAEQEASPPGSRPAPLRIELVEPNNQFAPQPADAGPRRYGLQDIARESNSATRRQEEVPTPPPPSTPLEIDGVDVGFTPIASLSIAIATTSDSGNRKLPEDYAVEFFALQPRIPYGPAVYHKHFVVPSLRPASEFAYGPVYFEHRNLERHGTSHGIWQPFVSAAHFFIRVPALPYLAAAEPPWNDYYPSDPYQAGRPAPRVREWPVFRADAATAEAALAVGLILLIP